jgi:hypothetical protein
MVRLDLRRHRRLAAGLGTTILVLSLASSGGAGASTWHWHPQAAPLRPIPGIHPSRPPHSRTPSASPSATSSPSSASSTPPSTSQASTSTPATSGPVTSSPATTSPAPSSPPTSTGAPASTGVPTSTAPAPAGCANPKNPWSTLEACGWPGPANTGYRTAACPNGLTVNSGSTTRVISVTKDSTVLSCQRITGSLDVQAKNVVIKDSYVSYDGGGVGGSGVIKIEDGASATVDHVEVNGLNHTHSCVWLQGTAATVRNINCYGINDGIFSWADTGYSATTGDNFTISDSYFHNFTSNAANGHIDGYQTEGASNGTIQHNTYQMTTDADSAIAIWDSLKSSTNIAVSDNLIEGGGFSVYAEDYSPSESSPAGGFTVTNITFTGNVFSTHLAGCVGGYGTWFYRASWTYRGGPTDGWHRSGNTVLETGENLDGSNPHVNGVLCS